MTKVLVIRRKTGKKEVIEVEFEGLLEEIVDAMKALIDRKLKEKEKSCQSLDKL